MQTITFYKVVYVDEYGMLIDEDFQIESQARQYASNFSDTHIYRYKMLADVIEIT